MSSGLPPVSVNPFEVEAPVLNPCRYEVGKEEECGEISVQLVRTPEGKKIHVCPMHLKAINNRFTARRTAAKKEGGKE